MDLTPATTTPTPTPPGPTTLKGWLDRCKLVAILRGVRPDEAEAVCAALLGEGIAIVEVPLNSPEPIESIRRLAARFGKEMLVGAGTVMSPSQVDRIARAGGRLIVTPHADVAVVRAAKAHGLLACPGGFTPTEFFALLAAGADAVKLFPAEAATPAVLRGVRAVLPADTMVLPVGGIAADNLAPWLAAGAAGFGIGSSIYKPGDTPDIVAGKARALVAALASAS
jgi:2-dehydro-3-deoxyphosphogalactonate aldolase